MTTDDVLDDALVRTRISLHTVAEHVLAAGRYQATGRIGLVVRPGGFGTPPFGPDGRTLAVVHGDLVARSPTESVRTHLTTLRELGAAAGVRPGAPSEVYHPSTPLDLDAPLTVDLDAVARLADWFQLGDAALRQWHAEITTADDATVPGDITLWPEHFDVAFTASGFTFGASPGDRYVTAPYVYVVRPSAAVDGQESESFWNQPFGAARTWGEVRSAADAVSFFRDARHRAPSVA